MVSLLQNLVHQSVTSLVFRAFPDDKTIPDAQHADVVTAADIAAVDNAVRILES